MTPHRRSDTGPPAGPAKPTLTHNKEHVPLIKEHIPQQ